MKNACVRQEAEARLRREIASLLSSDLNFLSTHSNTMSLERIDPLPPNRSSQAHPFHFSPSLSGSTTPATTVWQGNDDVILVSSHPQNEDLRNGDRRRICAILQEALRIIDDDEDLMLPSSRRSQV